MELQAKLAWSVMYERYRAVVARLTGSDG